MSASNSVDNTLQQIQQIRDEFNRSTAMPSFLYKSKSHKFQCANQVAEQISLDILLHKTCWRFQDTSVIYVDYPILKSYATPELFDTIVSYIIEICLDIKESMHELTVFVNLDGFTVSAAERYRGLIVQFCDQCFKRNTAFAKHLKELRIYNTPASITHIRPIFLPLILEEIRPKMKLISKQDSAEELKRIFSGSVVC